MATDDATIEHVILIDHDNLNCISVCLYNEHDEIMRIGERLNEICEMAYMNGYNWAAIIDFWTRTRYPDLAEHMQADPEAGMYSASFERSTENMVRAEQLAAVIKNLINDEAALQALVRQHADDIEWD